MKLVELDYADWEDQFGPLVSNPNCPEYNCTTFETYGRDLAFVEDVFNAGVFGVWTLMTNDNGNSCICEGMHFVNRLAYIVTKKPYPANTWYYIKDN